MAWKSARKIPTSVVGVELRIKEQEGTGPGPPEGPPDGEEQTVKVRTATYMFWVRFDDGTDEYHEGDLLPHLTAAEKARLNALLTSKIEEITEQVL